MNDDQHITPEPEEGTVVVYNFKGLAAGFSRLLKELRDTRNETRSEENS